MAIGVEGGGKVKAKRNHGTKPYARNNTNSNKSLFQRVTDTVSLLLPSWMPNFKSWQSTPENNSEQAPDHDEDEDEDVDIDEPGTSEPPEPVPTSSGNIPSLEVPSVVPPLQFWPRMSRTTGDLHAERSCDSGAFSTQSVLSCNNNNNNNNEFSNAAAWMDEDEIPSSRRNGLERKIGKTNIPQSSYSRSSLLGRESVLPPTGDALFKEPATDNNSECSDTSVSTSGCSSMVPHPDKQEYQKVILQLNESSLRQLSEKLTMTGSESSFASKKSGPTARPPLRLNSHGVSAVSLRGSASEPFSNLENQEDDSGEINTSTPNQSELWSVENGSVQPTPRKDGASSFLSESFGSKRSKPQATSAGRRPSFSVAAFNNPVWNEKSVLNDPLMSSPFYSGRTCYGGASAIKRNRFQQLSGSPYNTPGSIVKRHQVKVKTQSVNDASNLDGMSSTSRRILDALETMSTPVKDAKRMPDGSRRLDTPYPILTSSRRPNLSGTNSDSFSKLGTNVGGPPTINLMTPGRSSSVLLNMNLSHQAGQRKFSVKEPQPQQTAIETRQNALLGQTIGAPAGSKEPTYSDSSRRKMKSSRREGIHYSRKQYEEEEEPVQLPNVALTFSSLPTFKIDLSKVSSVNEAKSSPLTSLSQQSQSETPISKASGSSNRTPNFDFCQPAPLQRPSISRNIHEESDQDVSFTFSSPLQVMTSPVEKQPVPTVTKTFSSPATVMASEAPTSFNFVYEKPTTTPKKKFVEDEKEEINTIGLPVASELKKGSVMDILGGKKSTSTVVSSTATTLTVPSVSSFYGFGDKFKRPADTWSCTTCFINNKLTDNKCAACDASKPGSAAGSTQISKGQSAFGVSAVSAAKITASIESTGFGSSFKPPVGNWKCPTCDVSNKAEIEKCVCCETAKPAGGNKASNKSSQAVPVVSEAGKSWECDTCMIKNQPNLMRCAACETPKPSSVASPAAPAFKFNFSTSSSSSSSGFNLGPSTNTAPATFKFGIPTSVSTPVTSVTTTTSEISYTTTTASSSSSTSTTISSGFVFGAPAGALDSSKPIPSFTFGAKSLTQKKDTDRSDSKSEFEEDKSAKPSEKFTFGVPKTISDSTPGKFSFGVAKSSETSAPSQFSFGFGGSKTMQKAEEKTESQKPVFGAFSKPLEPVDTTKASSGSVFASPVVVRSETADMEREKTANVDEKSTPGKHKSNEDSEEPSRKIPSLSSQSKMSASGQFSFGLGASTTTISVTTATLTPSIITGTSLFGAASSAAVQRPTTTTTAPVFGWKSNPPKTTDTSSIPSFSFGATSQSTATPVTTSLSIFSSFNTSAPIFATSTASGSMFGTSTTNSVFAPTSSSSVFQSPTVSTTNPPAPATGTVFFGTSSTTPAESIKSTAGSLFETPTGSEAATTSSTPAAAATATPVSQSFFSFSSFPQSTVTSSSGFGVQSSSFGGNTSNSAPLPSLSFPSQTVSTTTPMINPPAFGSTQQQTPSFGNGSQSTATGFTFGTPLTGNTNSAVSAATPAGSNVFGSANANPLPTFGPGQLGSTTPAFGNSGGTGGYASGFGSATGTGANPTPGTAPANRLFFNQTPSFQFGNDNQSSPGVFTFTGTQDASQPEQSSTFQFRQPTTGFQFNPNGTPQFNFGVNNPNPLASMPPNPSPIQTFNPGVINSANPNRQIRRARRRKP